jgi:hypothetical protein
MKKIAIPVLICALVAFYYPQKTFAAAPTDYISCWDLEEASGTRIDANTTNSNDLTDVNTVLNAASVVGNGADFERTNTETLTITDATQTGLDITGDLSFATWWTPESQPAEADADALMFKWSASQASYGLIYANEANNSIKFYGYPTGCAGANESVQWILTATTGVPMHITVRHDVSGHASGNGTAELFINGASQGTRTNTAMTSFPNCTGTFSLSALGGVIQWYADGVMDVTEIYNRLLTDTEISNIYNGGSGVSCSNRSDSPTSRFGEIIFY